MGSDVLVPMAVHVVPNACGGRTPAARVVLVVVDGGRWVGRVPKRPTPDCTRQWMFVLLMRRRVNDDDVSSNAAWAYFFRRLDG